MPISFEKSDHLLWDADRLRRNAQRAYRAGAKELNFMYEDAALLVTNVPTSSAGHLTVFGWLRVTPSAERRRLTQLSGLSKLLPGSWIRADKTAF